jgi:hypothetical protein
MNKSEIISILELLKTLPNSPIKNKEDVLEVSKLFHAVLEDLPSEMVKAATVQYCSEGNPFFPTPGTLRDKAMDLQMLAMGIPTPAEAWGMVLTANKPTPHTFCETGAALRDACMSGENYGSALAAAKKHDKECSICGAGISDDVCDYGGFRDEYAHSAVAETVRLLGGRDVILTDNPVSDRKQFIDAYRDVIARERMRMGMTPTVARYVEDNRLIALDTGEKNYLESQTRRLAEGLKK